MDALEKFVKGRLPFKSEEVPSGEDSMDGHTQMIVGNNFEEKVLQKGTDVILLVHAPWCYDAAVPCTRYESIEIVRL